MNASLERLRTGVLGEVEESPPVERDWARIRRSRSFRIALGLATAAVVFLADLLMPQGAAMGVPHVLVILISLRIGDGRVTYSLALLCTLLTLWGFHLSPESVGTMDPVVILTNRLAALLSIWSAAFLGIRLTTAIAQREAAMKEIKILKGRLPICAHCKKIRDGQEAWVQLEEYLLHHSEAIFSHSICPGFMDEHFGEYLE